MRSLLVLVLLFSTTLAAQPGDISKSLQVLVSITHPLLRNGVKHFDVTGPGGDSIPMSIARESPYLDHVAFQVPTRNGVDGTWAITDLQSGTIMSLHLQQDEELLNVQLRIPHAPGNYNVNMRHVWKCITDQVPEYPARDFNTTDTLACNGGRLVWTRAFGGCVIELMDMRNHVQFPEPPVPNATREASYPSGMAGFERFMRWHFSRAVIEETNVRTTLQANVTIEQNGTIHHVLPNGGNYPALDAEFRRVLQLSTGWIPAVVENIRNTNDPRTFRTIEQTRVIAFNVDPDSIWWRIPDDQLSILPAQPTSRDSIRVTLWWTGGSCGQYASEAEILPAKNSKLAIIKLGFGQHRGEMCCDIKRQSWTHVLPPLPPGRYRLQRTTVPGLQAGPGTTDPYAVRMIDVR